MSWASVAAVALAAIVASAIGVIYVGGDGTIIVLALMVAIGAVTFGATRLVRAARRRGRAGRLSRQLAVAVAIVIGPLLLALALLGRLMFVSGHDAALVAVIVSFTGVLGVVAANWLSAAVIDDIESVRDGLIAVGRGERELRIVTEGHDELGELSDAANAMIDQLASEEVARAVRAGPPTPRRGHLARSANADHLAAAAGRGRRRPHRRRRAAARVPAPDADPHRRCERPDRRPVRALEAGGGRHQLVAGARALPELVSDTVAAMRVHAELKGVAVRAEVPHELDAANANSEKLQRVLFNLIQNAIRHTPADGSVVVRAEPVAGSIEIEVSDTGTGIAPDERELVFGAFYRARARRGATDWRHWARTGRLAGDRRSPWRADLASRVGSRDPSALQPSRHSRSAVSPHRAASRQARSNGSRHSRGSINRSIAGCGPQEPSS